MDAWQQLFPKTEGTRYIAGMSRNIILASASPRRRDLLLKHGFTVEVLPSDAPEMMPDFLTVGEMTLLNARIKAHQVTRARPESLVLAADTLVALDGRALGKPAGFNEAFEMLSMLSGRTHEVFTGVWLEHRAARKERGFIAMTQVTFRKMKPAEIREYIARVNPLDKAGAYAAQQNEMGLIEAVEGSHSNVVGLPMEHLLAVLEEF